MMNENKLKQFIEEAKAISLTMEEKHEIKVSLLAFMHFKPNRQYVRRTASWFFSDSHYIRWGVTLVCLAVIATSSFSAESALPGDLLYKFKVSLNEKILTGLKFSIEEEIKWDIERMSRRLEEAESLAVSGRMDSSTSQLLGSQFDETARNIQTRVLALKKENDILATDLDNNFMISVQAHHNVMSQLASDSEELQSLIKFLNDTISSNSTQSLIVPKEPELVPLETVKVNPKARASHDADSKEELESQAYKKRETVEDIIRSVKVSLVPDQLDFAEDFKNEMNSRILKAQALLSSGSAKLYEEKFEEAIDDFNEATILMGETKLIIDINRKLKINFKVSTDKFKLN